MLEREFTVHGHSCDPALHPVSEKTAKFPRSPGFGGEGRNPTRGWNDMADFSSAKFEFTALPRGRIMGERGRCILGGARREFSRDAPGRGGPPFPFRDKASRAVSG